MKKLQKNPAKKAKAKSKDVEIVIEGKIIKLTARGKKLHDRLFRVVKSRNDLLQA